MSKIPETRKLLFGVSLGSGLYLFWSSVGYMWRRSKINRENKRIQEYINNEIQKLGSLDYTTMSTKDKCELCFYIYLKGVKKIYSNEFTAFDNERRHIFDKYTNLNNYIACIEKFEKSMKTREENFLNLIVTTLGFNQQELDKVLDEIDKE